MHIAARATNVLDEGRLDRPSQFPAPELHVSKLARLEFEAPAAIAPRYFERSTDTTKMTGTDRNVVARIVSRATRIPTP
ncbi:hypothetical protein ACFPRL_06220 [Pseudoclavibacter helvolus]